jgi:hypothetical protein
MGLNPEAVGDSGAKAAEGGKKAGLADLLAEAEGEFGTVKESGAIFPFQTDLEGDADGAEEKKDGGDEGEAEPRIFDFRFSIFD